jgi:(p)ppGpp synthase/HD superfamily hydrolase
MPEESLRTPLTGRFTEALTLACILHRRQARKGTQIPYIAHLLAVASIALEHGATEDEAIAAVLHDAIEDQGGPPTEMRIRDAFGENVAAIVRACSDTDEVPKPPWRERKQRYIAHLGASDTTPSARLVPAADKLHNARSILADYRTGGESLWSRFNAGRDDTLWYYRSLVDLRRQGPHAARRRARSRRDRARSARPRAREGRLMCSEKGWHVETPDVLRGANARAPEKRLRQVVRL